MSCGRPVRARGAGRPSSRRRNRGIGPPTATSIVLGAFSGTVLRVVTESIAPTLGFVTKGLPQRRSLRRPKPFSGEQVWIVQHDETPHNTVLGVFATDDEAYVFMDAVKDDYPDGVICSSFPIPYRSTDGAVRYRTAD